MERQFCLKVQLTIKDETILGAYERAKRIAQWLSLRSDIARVLLYEGDDSYPDDAPWLFKNGFQVKTAED